MGVTVNLEVGEIVDRFARAGGRYLARPHEAPESLHDLDVHEVRHMKFVAVAKDAGLDSGPTRRLQEKLQQRRRVDNNHADSRSSRITTAAGVFKVTRRRV